MKEYQRKDHTVKRKHKQEPFEPTVGLTQVGVLHGEFPGEFEKDQMIAHLRQENAEIKADYKTVQGLVSRQGIEIMQHLEDLQRHKAALDEARWLLTYSKTHLVGQTIDKVWNKRRDQWLKGTTPLNPQPTQDPATAISRLYPSSARPVNPKP